MLWIKIIIIVALITILYQCGRALHALVHQKSDTMAKALIKRVSISLGLFIFLLLAMFLGWLSPHALTSIQA